MLTITELFSHSEHRYNVRHIHTNLRKSFRGKALKDQFWSCAKSTYFPVHERVMDTSKGMSIGAYEYMKNIEPYQ